MSKKFLLVSVSLLVGVFVTLNVFKGFSSGSGSPVSLTDIAVFERPSVPPTKEEKVGNASKKVVRTLTVNRKRVLELKQQVDELVEHLVDDIAKLSTQSKEAIVLLIDSPGGSVFIGEKILTAIENSEAPVYTVCVGLCASMAAIIHQHGVKRYALDRSALMFHDASGGLMGKLGEMKSLLLFIQRKIDKTNAYIASRSGISLEQFKQMQSNNLWIDAEDSKNAKFVDELVRLKINE